MPRYFIDLSYRGAPFAGWQIQPGQRTVQGVLEGALATLLRRPVPLTGAGRTDAGVNARLMVAHADLPDSIVADSVFLRSLNAIIGPDIAVYGMRRVPYDAHARFDATGREYRYFVTTRKNPFACGLAWPAPPRMDFDAMNEAAGMIIGTRDFTSFAKLHSDTKTNVCDVRRAVWVRDDMYSWHFEIVADRFLRNMVRAVVGTLADVGRGKMPPAAIMDILESRNRCAAGTSMPPGPLFLWNVEYPY